MGLPDVKITIVNEPGVVEASSDKIAGMILSGVAVATKIALNEPKQIFGLSDAALLGIDAAYDVTNSADVYFQISEFYKSAGNGTELWIMLIADTVSMEDALDGTIATNAVKLLDAAKGTIRMLAISRFPDASYTATIEDGLDDDVWAAAINGQALAEDYAAKLKPFRLIIAGREWSGVAGDLLDLRTTDYNRVAITLCSQGDTIEDANIGIVLGSLAALPVQRKISRTKNGSLQLTDGYLTDGSNIDDIEDSLGSIHDKGYIIFRKYPLKAGVYFNSDKTATSADDSYNSLAKGRVIDKAVLLTYLTYVDEIDDDVELNPDGTLPAAIAKSLQSNVEKSINEQMTANGEISSIVCTIDPTQDVATSEKLKVRINVIPVGYKTNIEVEIGFNLQ